MVLSKVRGALSGMSWCWLEMHLPGPAGRNLVVLEALAECSSVPGLTDLLGQALQPHRVLLSARAGKIQGSSGSLALYSCHLLDDVYLP